MILKLKYTDFLMAKRLKRRLARENKDRSGCMSGIISVFDFRHGRITRRLLSDHRTHMTESTTGPSYPTSEANSLTDSEEMQTQIESPNNKNETVHTRVKELMDEEMRYDQTHDLEDLMNKLLIIHKKTNEKQNPNALERSNSKTEEHVTRKNRNLLKRRSKSHECILLNDNTTPLHSNTTNTFHHERSVSHFSLTEIKKKLKNAIGKSSKDSGCREKPVIVDERGGFYSERFSTISNGFKSQDEVSRLCKSERKSSHENIEFGDTSDRISNIYVEAKKHLSEMMINNGDGDNILMVEKHSRTLGNLLSFPDYNSLSSGIGSRNDPEVNESQPFVTHDEQRESEVFDEDCWDEDVVEIVKPLSPQEIEVPDELVLTEEDEFSCSPIASPSHAIFRKSDEGESTSDDRTGKPSPVSVLEPLFSDYDISPARTVSGSVEYSIQPLRLRFEEPITPTETQETCIHNHVENEESIFEYVESLLLASDLNWAEFEQKWLSSVQILDPSLYHELQIFSTRPGHDQRLLFDTTNEILSDVCDHFLGFFFDLSYFKPNINSLPEGMNLINEVWERIESRLNYRYPRSLDQLIKKDFEVSRTWTDLRLETREIVTEIEELMFEDMIYDVVFSLISD